MSSLSTAEKKEEMEAKLHQLIKSYDDKMSLYNDIHNYVDEMAPHKFPDGGEVLPEKEGVLRVNPKRCSRDKRKLDKEGNECNE